jgi:TRAP-type mannitol/chloroaromatic compound transport system permease large subunit
MLKGGYDVRLSAGAITAGGCLGILIPPSVMLIVYGATAGVSVVQLYAGAFFPGIMLAGLYIVYVIIVAKLKPEMAPPLSEQARFVPLPPLTQQISDAVSNRALPALIKALKGSRNVNVPAGYIVKELFITLLPALLFAFIAFMSWRVATAPLEVDGMPAGMDSSGGMMSLESPSGSAGGLAEPPSAGGGLAEPPSSGGGLAEPPAARSGLAEPPGAQSAGVQEPPGAAGGVQEPPGAAGVKEPPAAGGVLAEPPSSGGGLAEPPAARSGLAEPPGAGGLSEPPGAQSAGVQEPPGAAGGVQEPPGAAGVKEPPAAGGVQEPPGAAVGAPSSATSSGGGSSGAMPEPERRPASMSFWIGLGIGAVALVAFYGIMSFQRLEVFKMLLSSFFPLVVLILSVLGSIVFGLATPTEAAAVGAFGGFVLAAAYKQLTLSVVKESVFLTAKTSAMVCWLFVGSAIFSAAFALLGGQELVEKWVMSMNLTKTEFLILSQVIIFILGWPLEWTEIIVIFMPIFIPLLDNFGVDPLFFGLLVALNLQTAFLSPPVAMAAFYLKGVSPPHVTLNQIFAGMLPFMGIQVVAIVLLYNFPAIGMWLPQVLYR